MIKKSIFEDEIISNFEKELVKSANVQNFDKLEKAADYLNSAIDILDNFGMKKHSDKLLSILIKIAEDENLAKQVKDWHSKNLNSEKMTKNLKEHGTVFNMADDGKTNKLLNQEVTKDTNSVEDSDLEVEEDPFEMDFEDEKI